MKKTLTDGLAALGLPQTAVPQLLEFAARLLEKNQVMNLTAITEPDRVARLHLLDSLGKRIAWLDETCREMGLGRVECVHARAEEFAAQRRESYDVATSRAVADLPLLCELALPLVKVGGQFLAMKSVDSDEEIARARGAIGQLGGKVAEVYDYAIPESDVVHRVVVIEKVRPTPPQFPRPWAKIKKAPLK